MAPSASNDRSVRLVSRSDQPARSRQARRAISTWRTCRSTVIASAWERPSRLNRSARRSGESASPSARRFSSACGWRSSVVRAKSLQTATRGSVSAALGCPANRSPGSAARRSSTRRHRSESCGGKSAGAVKFIGVTRAPAGADRNCTITASRSWRGTSPHMEKTPHGAGFFRLADVRPSMRLAATSCRPCRPCRAPPEEDRPSAAPPPLPRW